MMSIVLVLICVVIRAQSQKVVRTHYAWEYQPPNRKDMIDLEAEKKDKQFKETKVNPKITLIEQLNGETFLFQQGVYIKIKNDLFEGEDYLSPKFYPKGMWIRVYTSTIPEVLRRVQQGQAVMYEHNVILFGGCAQSSSQNACFNQVIQMNLKTRVFSELFVQEEKRPSVRRGHQVVLVGSKAYLFGGESGGSIKNIDVWIYDIPGNTWTQQDNRGNVPMYTSHFRCVLTSNHFILCYGGLTDQMQPSPSRLYSYDYLDALWRHIDTTGLLQHIQLFSFGMAYIRDQLFLFGGQRTVQGDLETQDKLYVLNLNSMVWYETRTFGEQPSGRHGFTLNRNGNELWLVGGCDQKTCFSEVYILDSTTLYWRQKVHDQQDQWKGKAGHVSLMFPPYLLVLGGSGLSQQDDPFLYILNTDQPCPAECHYQGRCQQRCQCLDPFFEHDCHVQLRCQSNCNDNGICTSKQKCKCYQSFTGAFCQYNYNCPQNCTNSHQGKCIAYNKCKCLNQYSGNACQIPYFDLKGNRAHCLNQCSGDHGKCIYELSLCNCTAPWIGEDCSIKFELKIPFKLTIRDENDPEKEIQFGEDEPEEPKEEEDEPEPEPEPVKPPPKQEEPEKEEEAQTLSLDEWLNKFMKGDKVKTKKRKKIKQQKEVDTRVYRHKLPVYTEEYNHSHYLVPEMFGIDNLDEYIIQQELQDFPKLLQQLTSCRYQCHNNGVCFQGNCYCRQGYFGRYCDILQDEFFPGGLSYSVVTTMVIYAFGSGAFLCFIYLSKQRSQQVEADNRPFT